MMKWLSSIFQFYLHSTRTKSAKIVGIWSLITYCRQPEKPTTASESSFPAFQDWGNKGIRWVHCEHGGSGEGWGYGSTLGKNHQGWEGLIQNRYTLVIWYPGISSFNKIKARIRILNSHAFSKKKKWDLVNSLT